MACITLFAQPLAMATTQLPHVVRYEAASTSQFECKVDRSRTLHMSWVVVTDGEGKSQLCIRWASDY
jgi:hypothetical protein